MTDTAALSVEPAEPLRGGFSGLRTKLFRLLLGGYLLLVPTLGVYRFWLVTRKRRYYWSRTRLGGEALEYSGTATEILFGFLVAVAIFVPFTLFFAYMGTQTPEVAGIGTLVALLALFLLFGFAQFRSRRYRLTRTFWRGIRFSQSGSAWKYAFMRLGWYLLFFVSAGLSYPFMAASLFRYRYDNTWWGDCRLRFEGSWRDIAGPWYGLWFALAICGVVAAASFVAGGTGPLVGLVFSGLFIVIGLIAFPFITARERTRFTSKLKMGDAAISLHIRARSLIWMYLAYALVLGAVFAVAGALIGYFVYGGFILSNDLGVDAAEIGRLLQRSSWLTLVAAGAGYLAFIGTAAMVGELFLGLSFWRLVVGRLRIDNPAGLDLVRAFGERSPAIGEGLADALSSGGY